jgi:hypothetical protein
MKNIAFIFGVIGIASGLLFALGPFMLGTPGPSPAFFIAPAILGLLVAVTHWRNIRRLRASAPGKAPGLLVANLLLLAVFVFAFYYELSRHPGEPRLPYFLAAIGFFWCLPLAVNACYLVFASPRSKAS